MNATDFGLAAIAVVIIKVVLDFVKDILRRDDKKALTAAEEAKAAAVRDAAREAADVTRESARRAEMDSHRREVREDIKELEASTRADVKEILATVSDLAVKAGGLMGTVEASQKRTDRFHEHDWPMLVQSVSNLGKRVHGVEVNQEHIREHVGMGPTPTPADGIRIRMGIPIPIDDDGGV